MTGPDLMAWAILIGIVLSIVVVVCWIILPFAILGTKPLLRELIAEVRRTNELLAQREPSPILPPGDGRIEPR